MDSIIVKSSMMSSAVSKQNSLSSDLYRLADEIGNVQRSLSFNVKSRAQISSQLVILEKVCSNNAVKTKKLSSALNDAIALYTACENRVAGNPNPGTGAKPKSKGGGSSAKKSDPKDSPWKKFWDGWDAFDVWKYIKEAGPIGAMISAFGSWATKGVPVVKGLLGVASSAAKSIGYFAKNAGQKIDLKYLLGINKGFEIVTRKNFGVAFKEELSKLKFSNATKVSDKIATGAKWAGYAITGITTFYDNFTDKENTTFGRRLAESIGESAVKIGGGILIGAGVAAGFAAAGVAAPAVVVGGITVGVTWLIDKGFEAATGKGAAEWISDTVIDTVGPAIQNAGKKISGWWNSLWK